MAMVQYDYESIKNELISRLEKKLNGRIMSNSTAMYLIEILAERFSQITSYSEYLTRESKWSLAQNTSSILTQLELFGYKPHRKKGASGKVIVSTDPNFSTRYQYNILIPKFTQFSNGTLTYCSTEDVTLTNTSTQVEVPVVQGDLKTTGEFLGNSFSGDVYTISNDSIENNVYELRNNNILCKEVDYFGQSQISVNGESSETYTYNNFEYRIKNLPDFSGIQIEFAPNSHDSNDHFEFKYLITEGELGSCFDYYTPSTPKNGITQVISSVTDSQGSVVRLYVRNIDKNGISGGTDVETIDEMRSNAPYTFNRVDKIITKNDYIAAIQEVMPSCIFNIWTEASLKYENEISQMNEANDFINNSKIFFTGVKYDSSRKTISNVNSTELYDTILDKINSRKSITDYFILNDSDIFKFYINGKIYYDRNKISDSLVRIKVSDAIYDSYSVSKAKFKKDIYRSNYTGIFNNITGINHVDVNLVAYTDIPFELNGQIIVTNQGKSRKNFGFKLADTAEILISKQFVFTSVDDKNSDSRRLVKDLFIIKETDPDLHTWGFFKPDGITSLSSTITWESADGQINTTGVLNSFKIDISTNDGKDIYYGSHDDDTPESTGLGLDSNGLVCRFVPENFNLNLSSDNQIAIYSDAIGENISGVLNPWKDQGKDNWWYGQEPYVSEDKYGIGLMFEAE